jgi:ABC-type Mn2+/Zn2+ transport system ATPase subunit
VLETSRLRTFSSGERKKIYLNCIKQNPEYIIVDNPLDHLDQNLEKNNHNYFTAINKNAVDSDSKSSK